MRFDTAPTSGVHARRFITAVCQEWSLPELIPDAQLIVTELVENAIRHGRTAGEVTVRLSHLGLWIGVWDGGLHLPRRLEPTSTQPGGRGIVLIDEISREWGVDVADSGKTVWALLARPEADRPGLDQMAGASSSVQTRRGRP